MANNPRSAGVGLKYVLKYEVGRPNRFRDMAIWKFCHFGLKLPIQPQFRGVLGAYLPQMTSHIVQTTKRTLLGRNHVVWAIKRENLCHGSGWAFDREKKLDSQGKKITKALYFAYLGRSPHWTDLHKNLHGGWCPRRNHVCQVSNWNF